MGGWPDRLPQEKNHLTVSRVTKKKKSCQRFCASGGENDGLKYGWLSSRIEGRDIFTLYI